MHNAHVVLHYRFMCWLAEKERKPIAQLYYYTLAMLEEDPNWKPAHLSRKTGQ